VIIFICQEPVVWKAHRVLLARREYKEISVLAARKERRVPQDRLDPEETPVCQELRVYRDCADPLDHKDHRDCKVYL